MKASRVLVLLFAAVVGGAGCSASEIAARRPGHELPASEESAEAGEAATDVMAVDAALIADARPPSVRERMDAGIEDADTEDAGSGLDAAASVAVRVRTGKADVRGALSPEIIRRVIRRHINEVRFCFEQALSDRPDLSGRVVIAFIIAPSGFVRTAAVSSSTVESAVVELCIAKAVRRWTFPAPDDGGEVSVSIPFVFQPNPG